MCNYCPILTESEMSSITRLELCGKNSSLHHLSLTKAYTHTATLCNSPSGSVKTDRHGVKDMHSVSLQILFPNEVLAGVVSCIQYFVFYTSVITYC